MNSHPELYERALTTIKAMREDELDGLVTMYVKPEEVSVHLVNNASGFSYSHELRVRHLPTNIEFTAPNSHRSQHRNRQEGFQILSVMLVLLLHDEHSTTSPASHAGANVINDSTASAVVDKGYHWQLIDEKTPRGKTLQLINRAAGCAHYGILGTQEKFYTHWAPAPTFED